MIAALRVARCTAVVLVLLLLATRHAVQALLVAIALVRLRCFRIGLLETLLLPAVLGRGSPLGARVRLFAFPGSRWRLISVRVIDAASMRRTS